jgi:hypothetical protein
MWKIKDSHEGMDKNEIIGRVKQDLEGLKNSIPEIKTMEIGRNSNELPTSFDIALYSEFESMEDLEIYKEHPEHVKVAQFIRQVTADAVVVDYET